MSFARKIYSAASFIVTYDSVLIYRTTANVVFLPENGSNMQYLSACFHLTAVNRNEYFTFLTPIYS